MKVHVLSTLVEVAASNKHEKCTCHVVPPTTTRMKTEPVPPGTTERPRALSRLCRSCRAKMMACAMKHIGSDKSHQGRWVAAVTGGNAPADASMCYVIVTVLATEGRPDSIAHASSTGRPITTSTVQVKYQLPACHSLTWKGWQCNSR